MQANKKRPGPHASSSKKGSKKSRFQTIQVPGLVPAAAAVSSGSTSVDSTAAREVTVHNFNYSTAADGRLNHRTTRRRVAPHPAEGIFAKTPAPYSDVDDSDLAAVLEAFPSEDTQSNKEPSGDQQPAKAKRVRADLRSANKVREWLPFRDEFLDELLLFEGCEDPIEDGGLACTGCGEPGATLRCIDCFTRDALYCKDCLLQRHQAQLPLHRVEEWDGDKFVRRTLRELGAIVQLGHKDGNCTTPSETIRRVVVADITGVQAVDVRFCDCVDVTGDFTREWTQLFRRGWFPATTNRPATAFTFTLLDTFQELNFQGKTNLYDFWKTIERLTDNSGSGVFNRYKQLSHVMRLWRHLTALKRFARGHDPTGPGGTKAGELALECAACPHPEKNLPQGWADAPPDVKWLYTLFLMIDANFRARCKDRKLDDFELASGWSYYVEETKYQAHVKACAHRKEENTCSAEHNAITKAHLSREGYIASGIGAVLCARHALVRKNGTGDLQLGERQANMDYLVLSTVLGILLSLLFSYDIACQWYKHLFKRMLEDYPPEMHIDRSKIDEIRFAIPKKHFRVHGPNHSHFSLNFLPRVGRTYGEGIETQWGVLNPLALSTREMSPGMRHEVFNDHWGAWNWQKTIGFGDFLLHALEVAHVMRIHQRRAFVEYSATFEPAVVRQWEAMVQAWERDPLNSADPFEEPHTSISYATAKKQLNEEEAIEALQGVFPAHDVTPGIFLQLGLEIEDQQYVYDSDLCQDGVPSMEN
ncbi:hypothetical protein TRAPUB_8795 [Trametes pubescens]|uniref:CxC2-like cysteine cluster KDZ transposase-associated domain-containing protein n=1 Tax=Trametes pubescens TaxID=154538 RepID=A0A1M2W4F9_TRAPU|nr:hypothetical protein TRAPUB_8795 [Trametes pubescens]